MCVCVFTCTTQDLWRSGANSQQLVLSFLLSLGTELRLSGLRKQRFSPLNHLTGP